jgi:hypothetical protein
MHSGSCFNSLHSVLLEGEVLPFGNEEYILPFCSVTSELTFPEHTEELPRNSKPKGIYKQTNI